MQTRIALTGSPPCDGLGLDRMLTNVWGQVPQQASYFYLNSSLQKCLLNDYITLLSHHKDMHSLLLHKKVFFAEIVSTAQGQQ